MSSMCCVSPVDMVPTLAQVPYRVALRQHESVNKKAARNQMCWLMLAILALRRLGQWDSHEFGGNLGYTMLGHPRLQSKTLFLKDKTAGNSGTHL